jgi:hypothetical protein
MPVKKTLVALHLVSFFFTSAVPYRGAVPDNHAPLFPPQRRNTLQLVTPPKKPYGSNVPSYKSVIFSQVPSVFLCDNQSAISLVHNPAHHQRTKPIDVKCHLSERNNQMASSM